MVLEDKGLRNYGTDVARTEQAGQGSNEMDKKHDQIAHRRIVAGREILRKYGRNNNSPATGTLRRVFSPLLRNDGQTAVSLQALLPGPAMLQIVLFRAYLNIRYPRLAVPIRPLIDKLLEEEKRAAAEMRHLNCEELSRVVFGPVPPFTRKT